MYDVVVVGQGLTGLLSSIWTKEKGHSVALVSQGTGKIIQSSGVMDLSPGKEEQENTLAKPALINKSVEEFKDLTSRLGYPYQGNVQTQVPVVTGSGYVKMTTLYPETITPVPKTGNVVIIGFQEITDFKPEYIKGNLQKERPELTIDAITVRLGKSSLRTMTQLDAARLLEQKEIRASVIQQIKSKMSEQSIKQPKLFVFPASLGVGQWRTVLSDFRDSLGSAITEAPGMPPNATAIRLNDVLVKEAVRTGIRFYTDTIVAGSNLERNQVQSLVVKSTGKTSNLEGLNFIIAGGGVLGGGLEVTAEGLKEQILRLEVDEFGQYVDCPRNVFPVGASQGTKVTQYGVTGGIYSILSSYEVQSKFEESFARGIKHA
jgi:glycerol-3-phosphate dehydrogenase subunit B